MSQKIETARQLFEHHLKQQLWVERKLADEVLPELHHMLHNEDLKHDVEHHLDETRAHVRALEQVFDLIHAKPEAEESKVLKGLREEHDEGMKLLDESDHALMDLFHAGVIAKNEHAEIAAYNELIEMADEMGEHEVANLLRENLEQEEGALRKAEHGLQKLLKTEVRV